MEKIKNFYNKVNNYFSNLFSTREGCNKYLFSLLLFYIGKAFGIIICGNNDRIINKRIKKNKKVGLYRKHYYSFNLLGIIIGVLQLLYAKNTIDKLFDLRNQEKEKESELSSPFTIDESLIGSNEDPGYEAFSTRPNASNTMHEESSDEWKLNTDDVKIVEIPEGRRINTTLSPEEIKDIAAMYDIN